MLTIKYQTAFKKDYKRIVRRGYDVRLLEEVISILAEQKPLPEIYRDHNLSGDYIGCRECHITPDWLLIYEIKNDELVQAFSSGLFFKAYSTPSARSRPSRTTPFPAAMRCR